MVALLVLVGWPERGTSTFRGKNWCYGKVNVVVGLRLSDLVCRMSVN